jgi:hypothetical protein
MDRLFEASVRFEDFCVAPTCAPSRCALMTGMHEFKSGVTHTLSPRNRMSLETMTLADVLRGAGYATGILPSTSTRYAQCDGGTTSSCAVTRAMIRCVRESAAYFAGP